MNTTALLLNARRELEMFQTDYGTIVHEYLKSGGKTRMMQHGRLLEAEKVDQIIKCYFEKVEAVSRLTRLMNQEYLSTVHIETQKPQYAPKRWQTA